MNASTYYLELTQEDTPEPQPQPVTESDRLRAWFNAVTLPAPAAPNDVPAVSAEFFKYSVSVYHYTSAQGKDVWGLLTKSPQQKTVGRRSLGTAYARGDSHEDLRSGLERFIAEREAAAQRQAERTAAKRNARKEFVNPYVVGDILHGSWGYDKTQCDYFQVLEVRPLALKIRKIYNQRVEATGPDSATVTACKDHFIPDRPAQWVTIQIDPRYGHSIPSPEHGSLSKWDGRPNYQSWGH